ncbi:MAG: glycosyl transferase family 2, partial [Thiotrichaceae bacterium IS1]
MSVSVLILTLNEESNLPGCLESVKWCDDVVVLDSYSQDRTEEIAKQAGVSFIQRQFDNYASQRNYGLHEIKYKYPWVLMVDADEMVSTELAMEIQ